METEKLPQKYINTPFAYTRLHKNLTLLQQNILIKVSDMLQKYVQEYYGTELKDCKEIPRPMFSKAVKNSGLPELRISYSEMGVTANNYKHVNDAVNEILHITVDHPGIDKNTGIMGILHDPLFQRGIVPAKEANSTVIFRLNTEVVDYAFDMAQGYIRHPEDIARISTVERMPLLYYLVRHESQNWSQKSAKLTVFEIKDFLGMIKRNPENNAIEEIQCPKFSRFKERVLIPALEDIMRLYKDDRIDVVFKYDIIYPGTKTKGDPESIVFNILTGEDANKYIESYYIEKQKIYESKNTIAKAEQMSASVEEMRKRRGRPRKMPVQIEISFSVDYNTELLDALRMSFGNGTYGYDYFFGKNASCEVGEESVKIKVPASVVDTLSKNDNCMDKIRKCVADVVGRELKIVIVRS